MKRAIAAVVLAALVTLGAAAEGASLSFYGIRTRWWVVPTGADATLTYDLPSLVDGRKTMIYSKFGGGWEDRELYRDPGTGEPLALGSDANTYTWANFQWDIALTQGLIPGGFKAPGGYDADLLEAFLFYRGRYDKATSDATDAVAFPDWEGEFYTGFMGGLSWNGLEKDAHGAKSGLYAEAAVELAPRALNKSPEDTPLADFVRYSAKLVGALPLFGEKDDQGGFQGYLTDFASVDYVDGTAIPGYVNQTFGGRILRDSLGNCVRGYPSTAYDTQLKVVNNLEFRVHGPSFAKNLFYPIAFAFVDAGYYAGYAGATSAADSSGYLASAGAGLGLSALDLAQVSVVVAQPFLETDAFWWSIKLFLHF